MRNAAVLVWNGIFKTKAYFTGLFNRSAIYQTPVVTIEYDESFEKRTGKGELSSVTSFKLIAPAQPVNRTLPVTIPGHLHWKFSHKLAEVQPATYVMELEQGRACDDGVIITRENIILGGVSKFIEAGEYEDDITKYPMFAKKTLPPVKKIGGSVAALSAPSGRGYYHWMFDVLPRIQLLRAGGYDLDAVDKFFINSYISKFHVETLNRIGIPRNKIIESHINPHIQADKLIVPSLVGNTGSIPGYACDFLRNEFLNNNAGNVQPSRRLYINRGQVAHRRVINEPEIVELLKLSGFESIALETMSLTEQIALMASAAVVIAPHGAGLTNIVFCAPGAKVIEFLHPASVNVMYWTICNQMGYQYYYLLAEGEIPPEFVNPYLNGNNLNINIEKLKQLLQIAEIN